MNPRAYYWQWARLMDGVSWDEIMSTPAPGEDAPKA